MNDSSRWWHRKILNSSHEYSKSTLTYDVIPHEKDLKTGWTAPWQPRIKRPHWAGRKEILSLTKTLPTAWQPTIRRDLTNTVSTWGVRGLCPTSGTTTLGPYSTETSLQNTSLKTNSAYVQENHRNVVNRFCSKKAWEYTHLPRTQHRSSSLKTARPYVKEILLLIFKCMLERQGPVRTLPKDGGTGKCHFCIPLYQASAGGHAPPLSSARARCLSTPPPYCSCSPAKDGGYTQSPP